ncbi:unnamed protein product, partial [Urochloa humidicola]
TSRLRALGGGRGWSRGGAARLEAAAAALARVPPPPPPGKIKKNQLPRAVGRSGVGPRGEGPRARSFAVGGEEGAAGDIGKEGPWSSIHLHGEALDEPALLADADQDVASAPPPQQGIPSGRGGRPAKRAAGRIIEGTPHLRRAPKRFPLHGLPSPATRDMGREVGAAGAVRLKISMAPPANSCAARRSRGRTRRGELHWPPPRELRPSSVGRSRGGAARASPTAMPRELGPSSAGRAGRRRGRARWPPPRGLCRPLAGRRG